MRSGLGDLNLALSSFISHYISLHHPHTVMTLPRQNWASSVCSHNILYLQLLLHLSSVETVDTLGAFPGLATECLVHHCVTSI